MVTDDEVGDPAGLRINEVHPNPSDDSNFDGTDDTSEDEFVEIVNDSASVIDLGGYEFYDGSALRHTFTAGTELDPGCALVLFGGGDFTEGPSVDFQGAILLKASSGSIALNNSGDIASLRNPGGTEIGGHVWGATAPENGSRTMSPDLNPTNTFESHFIAGGTTASPGARTDGSEFCAFSQLLLSVSPATIAEDAGAMASVLTIMRTGDLSAPLTIDLDADDTEISIPATASFAIDEASINVDIDAVDDDSADNDQVVTITASALGFIDGTTTITVQDDGDINMSTVTINEVDYDEVGDDGGGEFVELYDGGVGDTPLDDYVIVFYNGNGGAVYRRIGLAGETTDAEGFYAVITPDNGIQNGPPDGVALFTGVDESVFAGTDVTAFPAGATLVDAIVYEAGADATLAMLGYAGPDLADSNSENVSLSRVPDGSSNWQLATPTLGVSNGTATGNAYDTWASEFPGIGSPLDDDDCDGLSNLLEYALGKSPLSPDRDGIPLGEIVGGQLQLTITKGAEAGADNSLTYAVEASTDLQTWSTVDTTVVEDSATTLTVSYTGEGTRVYLRLRVELG